MLFFIVIKFPIGLKKTSEKRTTSLQGTIGLSPICPLFGGFTVLPPTLKFMYSCVRDGLKYNSQVETLWLCTSLFALFVQTSEYDDIIKICIRSCEWTSLNSINFFWLVWTNLIHKFSAYKRYAIVNTGNISMHWGLWICAFTVLSGNAALASNNQSSTVDSIVNHRM